MSNPLVAASRYFDGRPIFLREARVDFIRRPESCQHPGFGCDRCGLANGFWDVAGAGRGASAPDDNHRDPADSPCADNDHVSSINGSDCAFPNQLDNSSCVSNFHQLRDHLQRGDDDNSLGNDFGIFNLDDWASHYH